MHARAVKRSPNALLASTDLPSKGSQLKLIEQTIIIRVNPAESACRASKTASAGSVSAPKPPVGEPCDSVVEVVVW